MRCLAALGSDDTLLARVVVRSLDDLVSAQEGTMGVRSIDSAHLLAAAAPGRHLRDTDRRVRGLC